eukprot:5431857-Pleurochrysis_carterae.AAC.3
MQVEPSAQYRQHHSQYNSDAACIASCAGFMHISMRGACIQAWYVPEPSEQQMHAAQGAAPEENGTYS